MDRPEGVEALVHAWRSPDLNDDVERRRQDVQEVVELIVGQDPAEDVQLDLGEAVWPAPLRLRQDRPPGDDSLVGVEGQREDLWPDPLGHVEGCCAQPVSMRKPEGVIAESG